MNYCKNKKIKLFKIKLLYKYKAYNSSSKKLLINNEIYLSSCSKFNDPFDAIPPFNFYDLTSENIYLKIYDLIKYKYPKKSERELKKICKEKLLDDIYGNKFINKLRKLLREGAEKEFGIVSLTSKKDDLLMWSHYADDHKGFCIGYDVKKLIDSIDYNEKIIGPNPTACIQEKINYSKVIPEFSLFDRDYEKVVNLLTTKSIDWKYEDEYRILKINSCNKTIKLDDETIKEIILGCKMNNSVKQEIREIVNNNLHGTKILEANMSLKKFKLIIN